MPAQVFSSFVHEDQKVADGVKLLIETELKLEDSVFQSSDKTKVYAGDAWLQKITDALREAEVVVLLLSRRSVKRPWVNFEAGGAWLAGKKIVPCCYGNQQKGSLPHPYSALQAVQLPEDAHYLLESIHAHLGLKTAKPPTPFLKWVTKEYGEGKDKKTSFIEEAVANLTDGYKALRNALKEFTDEA